MSRSGSLPAAGEPPPPSTADGLAGPEASRRIRCLAFVASGLVPLLMLAGETHDTMLLIYSALVGAWLLRGRVWRLAGRIPGRPGVKLFALTLGSGILTETLAWSSSYLARDPSPALLHPQLLYDLLLSPGIYAGWALAWLAVLQLYRYSLSDVFVIQGVYGVFLEQQGAVFARGLASLPAGVLLWLYVFLVNGSAMGLAYLPIARQISSPRPRRGFLRLPLGLAAGLAATAFSSLGWAVLLQLVGLTIPAPRPIWEAPLW